MCILNIVERNIMMLYGYCNYSNFGVFLSFYYLVVFNIFNDFLIFVINIYLKCYFIFFKKKNNILIYDSC